MNRELLAIRGMFARSMVIALLTTSYSQSALPASVSVKPIEVQQYWNQALGTRFDRYFVRKRLTRSGLIPATSSPPTRLSDDPPHAPGIASPAPGSGNESQFTPTNPEPIPDSKKPDAANLTITVKSYFASIGKNIGAFNDRAGAQRGGVLAGINDKLFSENPRTDGMNKDYRLLTRVDASVACSNDTLTAWQFSKLISDTGKEPPAGSLQSPRGFIRGAKFSRVNGSVISFEWSLYGKPHPVVEVGFQRVQPRTSVFAWHRIAGTISCVAGKPVIKATLNGSRFPTHRWWVNNVIQATAPQGPMSALWVPVAPRSNIVK